jgi:hypothetical protein
VNAWHEWKYRNALFVYQYDMPCYVRRREKGEKVVEKA